MASGQRLDFQQATPQHVHANRTESLCTVAGLAIFHFIA